jgi:hypothetical protein
MDMAEPIVDFFVKMENGFVAYDAFLKCEVCDEFLDLC